MIDNTLGLTDVDREILTLIQKKEIPYLLIRNKCDLKMESHDFPQMPRSPEETPDASRASDFMAVSEEHQIAVSAKTGFHIEELKDGLRRSFQKNPTPGASSAIWSHLEVSSRSSFRSIPPPEGRLILPQQEMTIRGIFSRRSRRRCHPGHRAFRHASAASRPNFPRRDRQPDLPESGSDRSAGNSADLFLDPVCAVQRKSGTVVRGAQALDDLQDGDTILISEGCTHHRQCEDIGTVKLPRWIQEHAKKSSETIF